MKTKLLDDSQAKTYAVIFQTGDEFSSQLLEFANREKLGGSHFTAIGAFSDAILGYFDWKKKDYEKIPVREQVEVVSLIGDIALDTQGRPKIHAHVVLGRSDGAALGGHLLEAHVRPTLEVVLTESPKHLERQYDPESKLALIQL
jgi:predicted DNA-binding protein with PD1-like motif